MNNNMLEILEFDKILVRLQNCALSESAKNKIKNLRPFQNENEVLRALKDTTEGKKIIESLGSPPVSSMEEIEKVLLLVSKEAMLLPKQLENMGEFLNSCKKLKRYLKKAEEISENVAFYGRSIDELSFVEEEIGKSIIGDKVDDKASGRLFGIRKKISSLKYKTKSKVESLLKNNGSWFTEGFISVRNGRYTLPLKKEFKNKIKGTVIDISKSGGTLFLEPLIVSKIYEEINILIIEEENEVKSILYTLTELVREYKDIIKMNMEAMEVLDFIFAKAKLSIDMKGNHIGISNDRKIEIVEGRHPLLNIKNPVPLNFKLGYGINGIVITGPNTGGKTVTLKTAGLFSVMAQSGLHVPAKDGVFTMNSHILCDIGDGQSITENLSTFSSHITNIINILEKVDENSFILLDELGSGTDPHEGLGLAISILEELERKNCLFVVTTHYPDIKDYAIKSKKIINARMTFDNKTLLPLYQLKIGEAGFSCALYIAKRLGLSEKLIDRAKVIAYGDNKVKNNEFLIDDKVEFIDKPKENAEDKKVIENKNQKKAYIFEIGDSVIVFPQKMLGIVYQTSNKKGEIGVQIKNNKVLVNQKRLKLKVSAKELYPEDYDYSIIFDSVEKRKNRKKLSKKHNPKIIVELNEN
jgi:dsDNA-specific endonuclease/ATPase MutS2